MQHTFLAALTAAALLAAVPLTVSAAPHGPQGLSDPYYRAPAERTSYYHNLGPNCPRFDEVRAHHHRDHFRRYHRHWW